jgi:hypothetical protein
MSAKITCNCGVPILLINKKSGDKIICNNCGASIIIGEHNKIIERQDKKESVQQEKEDSGFEKLEISQIVDAIHEEKKIAVQKLKRDKELHQNLSKNKNVSSYERKIPEIVKTGILSKKLKCIQCGELLKLDVKVCFNCGANPRTGKTYVPPPKKEKQQIKIPFGKIFLAIFLTLTVIAFFITVFVLLTKWK